MLLAAPGLSDDGILRFKAIGKSFEPAATLTTDGVPTIYFRPEPEKIVLGEEFPEFP